MFYHYIAKSTRGVRAVKNNKHNRQIIDIISFLYSSMHLKIIPVIMMEDIALLVS